MRLADFIELEMDAILTRWEEFAGTLLPAARGLDTAALRDHAEQILRAVCADLRTAQTPEQQTLKSRGQAPIGSSETAAQTHAILRATSGFDIRQLVAEYRALRASVLRQYLDLDRHAHQLEDVGRFNEAIDQAVAESVEYFTAEVDRWRNIFLGILGHDLRGPLNAIQTTARLLALKSPDAELNGLVARMHKSGQRMAELLDDLLEFNRVSIGGRLDINPRPTDMADACRQEIEVHKAAHPDAAIEFICDGSCPGIWDSSRIRQALGNLLNNAISYGTGGPVRIAVRAAGQHVVVEVENEGPTLSQRDIASIFNPLVRGSARSTDNDRSHLGLGLFIVQQTAQAHGGTVEVQSTEGRTRFSMILPSTPAGPRS